MSVRPIHVPVAELRASLGVVAPFVALRPAQPILTQLCFVEDTVQAAQHGELGWAGALAYLTWRTPQPFTVPVAPFLQLIESLDQQGEEKVVVEPVGRTVTLHGGGTTVRFSSMDPGEFPVATPPRLKRTKLTPEWWAAWERVAFIAREDGPAHFAGVYWDGRYLMAASTHRIARTVLALPPPTTPEGLLVPAALLRRLGGHQWSVVDVGVQRGLLWVTLQAAVVYGSLLAAEFPVPAVEAAFAEAQGAYRAPEAVPTLCEVESDRVAVLEAALERLAHFLIERALTDGVVAGAPEVTVRVERNALRIMAVGDGDTMEEVVAARVKGPPVLFTMRLSYLREALARTRRLACLPDRPVFFVGSVWEHIVASEHCQLVPA